MDIAIGLAQTLGPLKDLAEASNFCEESPTAVFSGVCCKDLALSAARLHLPCICLVVTGQLPCRTLP